MNRVDQDYLQESQSETKWRIHRHRENYLLELYLEDSPEDRAFAAFDEEEIVYTWIGRYIDPPPMNHSSEDELSGDPSEDSVLPSEDSPEDSALPEEDSD